MLNMRYNFYAMPFAAKSSSDSSQVLTFNSTAKWNAHFEAMKETNKLAKSGIGLPLEAIEENQYDTIYPINIRLKMMVIYFTASWCRPCIQMTQDIQEFAAKYRDVEFVKIDMDDLMEVSERFQVNSAPTFMLIKKGEVAGRVVGVRNEELQRVIEQHRK